MKRRDDWVTIEISPNAYAALLRWSRDLFEPSEALNYLLWFLDKGYLTFRGCGKRRRNNEEQTET